MKVQFWVIGKTTDTYLLPGINDYKNSMLTSNWEEIPPIFITSAKNKSGNKEVLNYINQLNIDYFDKSSS